MSGDGPDTVILEYHDGNGGGLERRRLVGVLGAASTLLVLVLIVALLLGALGALGVGIGGFVATFGSVNAGDGGVVYPTIAEQDQCPNAPQLMATLDGDVTVDRYFGIQKDVPVPTSPMDIGATRIEIMNEMSGNNSMVVEDLDLRLVALNAQETVLGNGTISEMSPQSYDSNATGTSNSSYSPPDHDVTPGEMDSFDTEFGIDASGGFEINDGRALTYQIAFGNVEINSVGLSVDLNAIEDANTTATGEATCEDIVTSSGSPSPEDVALPLFSDFAYMWAISEQVNGESGLETLDNRANSTESGGSNVTDASMEG